MVLPGLKEKPLHNAWCELPFLVVNLQTEIQTFNKKHIL